MGLEDPGNVGCVQEQNMVIINWFLSFLFFRLFFLCGFFKPFVKWGKSHKGEAVARGRAPSRGSAKRPAPFGRCSRLSLRNQSLLK